MCLVKSSVNPLLEQNQSIGHITQRGKKTETQIYQAMFSKGHIHKHFSIYVLPELRASAPAD